MNPSDTKQLFVVCDANVVIQMAIFNATKLFDSSYSFGKIQVHPATVQELERWLRPGSKKFQKFGKDLIEIAIKKSKSAGFQLKNLSADELTRKMTTYGLMEEKLLDSQKTADTSYEDKLILAVAEKNGCYLATQEETLRNLAVTVLGNRLLSFEDLIVDLFTAKKLSKEEIETGLHSLSYFKEFLRHDQKKKVIDLIK